MTSAAGEAFVGTTTQTQVGYGYDSNGAQTRVTTQTASGNDSDGYEWDFEGHLTRVDKDATHATSFTYDAGGNRIQTQTRAGAVTSVAKYLVDENTSYAQVLEERDAAGDLSARYVYGQGYGPLWMHRVQKNSAGVSETRDRFLLADGHGSVRQLITESGVVTDSYFYDAWGNALAGGSGNTVNPYRYNGQQADEATGGYYLRARYYQPGQGRFLGHDPVLGMKSEPVTLHRYLYAGADGVNFNDPSGRFINLGNLAAGSFGSNQLGATKDRVTSNIGARLIQVLKPFTTTAPLSPSVAGASPAVIAAGAGITATIGALSYGLNVHTIQTTIQEKEAEGKEVFVADSNIFQDRPDPSTSRLYLDANILGNPDIVLIVPPATINEVVAGDRYGTQMPRMNSVLGGATIILTQYRSRGGANLQTSGNFGSADAEIAAVANELGIRLLTSNLRMANQIRSSPNRQALPNLRIRHPGPPAPYSIYP